MAKRLPNGEESEAQVEAVAPQAEQSSAGGDAPLDAAQLAVELAGKTRELAELNDKYLRALADAENVRKRARQQSDETVRLQRENLIRDLLPIVDNLERAVTAAQGTDDNRVIIDGVEMVLRGLLDFLRGQGVSQLDAIGQAFDPRRHEAVDQIDSADHPPNTVVSEFHRGYLIGERTLRPARVAVTRSGGVQAPATGDDETES